MRLPLRKKPSIARAGLFGHVDLALAQALQQVVGRDVDELHLVGLLEHGVRHRLLDLHPGDLRHHVVEALEVLDVERGVDVDARHRAARPRPATAWHGASPERWYAPVRRGGSAPVCGRARASRSNSARSTPRWLLLAGREALEAFEEARGFLPAMGLDPADHHVVALPVVLLTRFQHGVGLAHARRTRRGRSSAFPRRLRASSSWTRARSASGSGRSPFKAAARRPHRGRDSVRGRSPRVHRRGRGPGRLVAPLIMASTA